MNNHPERAFCKIIVAAELRIPRAFIEEHGVFFPKRITLQTEADSEKSWKVSVQEKHGEYWLTFGWQKFRKDNGVDFLDFCVFRFVSDSDVLVTIYEKNGCNRLNDRILEESLDYETEASSSKGESEGDPSCNGDLYETAQENVKFSFKWKECMRNCMLIRGSICEKIGLREAKNVQLKNMEGYVKDVDLFKNDRKDGRVGLGLGWACFVDKTKFVEGETYEIEFIRMRNGKYMLQVSLIEQ